LLKDLLRLEAERGATIFLSTHSLDIAQELADRIGVVASGRLIICGTLEKLRQQAAMDGSLEDVFLKLTEEDRTEAQSRTTARPPLDEVLRPGA
jgi:ABC-2 type transport system ATP-binding protein